MASVRVDVHVDQVVSTFLEDEQEFADLIETISREIADMSDMSLIVLRDLLADDGKIGCLRALASLLSQAADAKEA